MYVGILGGNKDVRSVAYQLVTKLRHVGLIVETDYLDRSVKAQMKYANKIGAKNTVILGADEFSSGKVFVKNMGTGEQTEISLDKLVEFFKQN